MQVIFTIIAKNVYFTRTEDWWQQVSEELREKNKPDLESWVIATIATMFKKDNIILQNNIFYCVTWYIQDAPQINLLF